MAGKMATLRNSSFFACALLVLSLAFPATTHPAEAGARTFNIALDKSIFGGTAAAEQMVVWMAYGLSLAEYLRKTDQVGAIPEGRYVPTYEAELHARERQIQIWREITSKKPIDSQFMEEVMEFANAGFLREYVWFVYYRKEWGKPDSSLRLHDLIRWGKDKLAAHVPQTKAWIEVKSAAPSQAAPETGG